jgi:acetoin utilization protein AcuB
MRIRDMMTKNVITVESETLMLDARRMMKEKNIRRLPVVDKGKLVGIVTKQDLDEAAPVPTSSSSAFEFHSVLSKKKVSEVMKKNPVTLSPDTPFLEALVIGQENKISSFLVVENGKLIGITTESDIVRFLARALGLGEEGTRITVEGLGKKLGAGLHEVIAILDKNNAVLLSMLSLPKTEKKDWMIVLRLKTKDPDAIVDDFKKAELNVTYVA